MKKIFLLISLLFIFSCSNTEKQENIETTKITNPKILCLWDSLTAWYWVWEQENYPYKLLETLSSKWYKYEIINWWVSWDTSNQVLERTSLYTDLNPEIVILVVWWNDWLRWLPNSNLKENILKIIDLFPNSKIVLWWMDLPINFWLKYRSDFKKVYSDVKQDKTDIYLLDFS